MSTLLLENSHLLENIEWPSLAKELGNFAYFNSTRNGFQTPIRPKNADEILRQYDDLDIILQDYFPEWGHQSNLLDPLVPHFEDYYESLLKGKNLNFGEINQFFLACEKYFLLKKRCPLFNTTLENFNTIKNEVQKFRHWVSPQGEVHYYKIPVLRNLFKQYQKLNETIQSVLQAWIRKNNKVLQINNYDVVNDHYCVFVRSDAFSHSLGRIIAHSDSGKTLCVEPHSLGEYSPKRLEILGQIEEEKRRLLNETKERLIIHFQDLLTIKRVLLRFDWLLSKAQFCSHYGLIRPKISNTPEIHLENFYHPLIKDPVKNDLHLSNTRGLLISGPNTGGKTALLKTIALSQVLLHSGLFIPCDRASLFPFEGTFYFGPDAQTLTEGFSAFSFECYQYITMMNSLKKNNLILIDEIFSSTSSEEASALAMSLIDSLHNLAPTLMVITTHHSTLKNQIAENANYQSAHVGMNNHRPTYKLQVGQPGSSFAFTIFKNLVEKYDGIDITQKAKKYLESSQLSYEVLLESLTTKQSELDKLIKKNEDKKEELDKKERSFDKALELKKEQVYDTYLIKLKRLWDKSKKTRAYDQKFLEKEAFNLAPKKESTPPTKNVLAKNIEVGSTYFAYHIQKHVIIESVDSKKETAQIRFGAFSMECSWNQLGPRKNRKQSPKMSLPRAQSQFEYDVRGMRLEEFENLLIKALFPLTSGEVPAISIIHGHGDGVLKNWLRKYIDDHKDLQAKNERGNDGVTIITLTE